MLLISRKPGESFFLSISPDVDPDMRVGDLLSEPIRIVILRKEARSGVMVGVEAPKAISIDREELLGGNKTLTIEIQGVGE